MSKYIISLFKKNNLSYQKHYENMLIKSEKKYKSKGFYIYKCENLSMEEYILYLYQKNLKKLPISQNTINHSFFQILINLKAKKRKYITSLSLILSS